MLHSLGEAVRGRRLSARELTEEALRRIDVLDGAIGSVVQIQPDRALAEAERIDRLPTDAPLPLRGIPLLVKDCEDLAHYPTLHASTTLTGSPPAQRDSRTVRQLRAAGAVPVGKTSLPEFAAEGYTSSLLHGDTRNPWSPRWSPGGSSGGSAAALAAGLAPIATATDGGGSIRIPAGFCGLVGLKPTHGMIGREPAPTWLDLTTDGPIGSSVADVALLLEILRGRATGDPDSHSLLDPAMPDRPSHIIIMERSSDFGPLPRGVHDPFWSAATEIVSLLGVPARTVRATEVLQASPDADWAVIAAAEHVHSLPDGWLDAHRDQLHPATREFLDFGVTVTMEDYIAARRRRFDYTHAIDRLLEPRGILLSPTVAVEGIPADGRLPETNLVGAWPASAYNSALASLTGHPAVSVPAGMCSIGIPFGLQLMAPRGSDRWLLRIASMWEQHRPWPTVAPGYAAFPSG